MLAVNILGFMLAFLFSYELDERIICYSTFAFFIINTIVISKFITSKSLNIYLSIFLAYIIIALFRLCEVFVFEEDTSIMWASLQPVVTFFDLIDTKYIDYLTWWSILLFPMPQFFSILCLNKLEISIKNKKKN